jgi:hypothetical protein
MDLRREGSLGARGSMELRREGSLGARGSTELRPDETLVESFSATQREGRAGSWSPLLAAMTEILALSLTITTSPVGSEITSCRHVMKLQSGEYMFMMNECEISSKWNTVVRNGLACFCDQISEVR